MTREQLEEDQEVVEYCRKTLEYRKRLFGDEHQVTTIFSPLLGHMLHFSKANESGPTTPTFILPFSGSKSYIF